MRSTGVRKYKKNSIVALSRCDAHIAAAVVFFPKHGTDTARCHRQRLYHKKFKLNVAGAGNETIEKVMRSVKGWAIQDLEVSFIRAFVGLPSLSFEYSCNATAEVYIPSLKRSFVAVSWSWLCESVTLELGAVHDCHIAENDSANNEIKLLERFTTGS